MRNLIVLLVMALGMAVATAQTGPSFPRYNFDVGGGIGLGRGVVGSFVGDTPQGEIGAGLNISRMFGVSAEYMYYDLNLRQSVSQTQALPNANGNLKAWSLNGLVRKPITDRFGAYGIFGIGFYQRNNSSTAGLIAAGARCQPAWVWWDIYCVNGFALSQQYIGSNAKVAGGFNVGGGGTMRLNRWHDAKLFVEWRYHRAYTSDVKTTTMPITVGLRW